MISVLTQPPSSTPAHFPQSVSSQVTNFSEVSHLLSLQSVSADRNPCNSWLASRMLSNLLPGLFTMIRICSSLTDVDRTTMSPAFTAVLVNP